MIPHVKNVLLASHDQVAIDAVAAKLMGMDPMSIKFIRLAHEQGVPVLLDGAPVRDREELHDLLLGLILLAEVELKAKKPADARGSNRTLSRARMSR